MTAVIQRSFAVWFAEFTRWSVNSFSAIPWKWPSAVIVPLFTALDRRTVPLDESEAACPQLVTLHFDGEMEPRDLRGKKTFKGRLYLAEAGDVIYSKIDVRNGAIGVVPSSMPRVAVTSEFPVYRVRQNAVVPEYVQLLFRTKTFRQQINSMISGTSGRKRVEPDVLSEIAVPIPALITQRAILAKWQKARQTIATAEQRIQEIEAETERQFFAELGMKIPGSEVAPKVFAVPWTDFLRWSVSYNQTAPTGLDITRGLYPVVRLGSALKLVQYGTSEKANTRSKGVPVLRINNIKNRSVNLTDLKHIELPDKTLQGLVLQDGDILIIRTSGSRGLVGTCAVFHETDPYVYASYLIRIRTNQAKADPDYVSWFINSALGRQQVDAISRQIMQNNINSEELRSLQIPLPPLDVQRRIMEKVAADRSRIARESSTARAVARQIEADMEGYLLGTKRVTCSA